MESSLTYRIMCYGSTAFAIIVLICLYFTNGTFQILLGIIAGALTSLAVATFLQQLSSQEQETILRRVTFRLSGISTLGRDFSNLRWIAYVTRVSGRDGNPEFSLRIARLRKHRTLGDYVVEYRCLTGAPSGEVVDYPFTFVGLIGCVMVLIGAPEETSSVLTIDGPVANVGNYFGSGYITDWVGARTHTLVIVGTSAPPSTFQDLPAAEIKRFERWFHSVQWDVSGAFRTFSAQADI